MNVDTDIISDLQKKTDNIRNVCILAHVDHGKTTLTDHLIASNGLIHPKLAGEMRYMDSKEDEQARGITMKSSSISLLHVMGAISRSGGPNTLTKKEKVETGYLFNLIDSPGHVDFCSEVSTAVRLSDGAFVIVDAVEGVCIQTHAVLRQAWEERLTLCLVINKIDRLIVELQLEPLEAYERMRSIIAHVNMIMSSFRSEQDISDADAVLASSSELQHLPHALKQSGAYDAEEEGEVAFAPEKGNVAFGSAHDGWAFTTLQFATMYATKLGCSAQALRKALWGGYAMHPKTKRIIPLKEGTASGGGGGGSGSSSMKPLFVQLILSPIWKAYSVCLPENKNNNYNNQSTDGATHHSVLLGKMVANLGLQDMVSERALAHPDPKVALRSVMRAWIPLSEAILGIGVQHLPSPVAAAKLRLPRLLPARSTALKGLEPTKELSKSLDEVETALYTCDTRSEAPLIAYISKMIAVPSLALPRLPGEPAPANPNEERFLAFGRVFSGGITQGDTLYVLPSTYNPALATITHGTKGNGIQTGECEEATAEALFLMMGRGLERLSHVPAGNVFAMEGVGNAILKSATIASSQLSRPLAPLLFQSTPIVTVAVEPMRPQDMHALEQGLHLLHKADPLATVSIGEKGEHLLAAAGEVHLETCVKDLKERFARIDLLVSPPLVAFKESVAHVFEEQQKAAEGVLVLSSPLKSSPVVEATTPGGACTLRVQALALPEVIARALDRQQDKLGLTADTVQELSITTQKEMHAFGEKLKGLYDSSPPDASKMLERIWMFGQKGAGTALLLTSSVDKLWETPQVIKISSKGHKQTVASAAKGEGEEEQEPPSAGTGLPVGQPRASEILGLIPRHQPDVSLAERLLLKFEEMNITNKALSQYVSHSVEAGVAGGFQLAAGAGPLCDEPLWGVIFEVEARLHISSESDMFLEDVYGPFLGQVTSAAKQAFRRAVLESGPRLVESDFLCEITTSVEALSAVYAVLGRRRSKILKEDMKEGSGLFTILAYMPAEASFGFADELRRKSSGAAAASLLLSHWERIPIDPFYVPVTEEEREEFGEEGQGVGATNLAKKLIDAVRRRKGLPVEEKVVESATKQRTRARKV